MNFHKFVKLKVFAGISGTHEISKRYHGKDKVKKLIFEIKTK